MFVDGSCVISKQLDHRKSKYALCSGNKTNIKYSHQYICQFDTELIPNSKKVHVTLFHMCKFLLAISWLPYKALNETSWAKLYQPNYTAKLCIETIHKH